ncbi:MAG: futalosine hydrolase [Bacteroidota bacterium]|nr:futalosine hydrolase [Bacteroidota bacterium]
MNHHLIITPTLAEAKLLISALNMKNIEHRLYSVKDNSIDLLVCGPGLPAAMFHTMQLLTSKKYDIIQLAGIAGSYNEKLTTGSLVCIESEQFADIGVHDNREFTSLCTHTEWMEIYRNGKIKNPHRELMHNTKLPLATSNTVNTNNLTLEGIPTADIENMEGAGLFMIFNEMKIPFLEIRAISNQVSERNKLKWNIHTAVENLTNYLVGKVEKR